MKFHLPNFFKNNSLSSSSLKFPSKIKLTNTWSWKSLIMKIEITHDAPIIFAEKSPSFFTICSSHSVFIFSLTLSTNISIIYIINLWSYLIVLPMQRLRLRRQLRPLHIQTRKEQLRWLHIATLDFNFTAHAKPHPMTP
jgi:hypothetical protein